MRRRLMGAVAVAVVVSGCGGGSGGFPSVNGHPDPTAIAAKLHCVGYSRDGEPELFAATQGSCDAAGGSVSILTFASSDSESRWRKAGQELVGDDGTIVFGSGWALEATDADQAAMLQRAVDGKPVPRPTYPAVFADPFVNNCESGGGTSAQCECVLHWIEAHYTYEQAQTLAHSRDETVISKARAAC